MRSQRDMPPFFSALLGLTLSLSASTADLDRLVDRDVDRETATRDALIMNAPAPAADAAMAALEHLAATFNGVPILIVDPFTTQAMVEVHGTF